MNNHAVFEIKLIDGFSKTDYHPAMNYIHGLLSDIATELKKRGVKCGKVKFKPFSPYFYCGVSNKNVGVGIFTLGVNEDLPLKCSINCFNRSSFLKYLLKVRPPKSDETLEKICGAVNDIVNDDSRFSNVKWITREELDATIREWWPARFSKPKNSTFGKNVPLPVGLGYWFSWVILLIPIGAVWIRAAIWCLIMLACIIYMYRRMHSKL